jgi:hypothetical protein
MEFYLVTRNSVLINMSYLFIKENDSKIFKSFLSGNEIEVGVFVSPRNQEFDAGREIEIFYGDENTSSYRAEIRKLLSNTPAGQSGRSLLMMSLAKI